MDLKGAKDQGVRDPAAKSDQELVTIDRLAYGLGFVPGLQSFDFRPMFQESGAYVRQENERIPSCRSSAMFRPSLASLAAAVLYALGSVAALAQSQVSRLPDGADKQLVEDVCTGCHRNNQITRSSGYTLEGWRELASAMIDLSANPEDEAKIARYLVTHFPPNIKRAPKLIPGGAQIRFKEWKVPTLGQRSRDPIQASDGRYQARQHENTGL